MSAQNSREVQALRSLHELMTSVNSADQLAELLHAVVQGVVDIIGFEIAVIYVLDAHDILEVVAVAGDDDGAREALMGRRVALAELAEEFDIADHWGRLRFVPHERLPENATSSWIPDFEPLDVPDAWHPLDALYALLHDPSGRLLGILGVDLPKDMRRPGLLGRQVLEMYAVQAGLAIHHAQARARLSEQVALAEATRTVLDAPVSWLDPASILEHSLKPLAAGYRCDRLWVMTFDEGRETSPALGAIDPERLDVLDDPEDRGALEQLGRRAWERRRTVVVADLGDTSAGILDPEERARLVRTVDRLGGGHLLATPLGSGSVALGCVVMLRDPSAPTWSDLEAEAALALGHEFGRALMHERLYTTERRLNAELHELDRYKNELMGTITHELKAPLTVIDGHVEILEESTAPVPSVRAIRRGTERLQRLVEDLLLLGRVKDPHVPLERTPVDLAEVISEVEDLFSVEVRRRALTMSCPDLQPGVLAWGDRDELARAVLNVVGNAVKYTPDGGRVTLRLARDPGTAVFSCIDTGIGIDPCDQAGLFEEFNRSSNPQAHAVPGTGLGLAIVKRIVERHDGRISVASRRGHGSTFRIEVPAPPGTAS
jgi:signal transduction histidine kinase